MTTLMKNLRSALLSNVIVRRLSAADKNTAVHWEFFNQVYDAALAVAEEAKVEQSRYKKLSDWAEDVYLYLSDMPGASETMLMDRLKLIRMEAEGGPHVQSVQETA